MKTQLFFIILLLSLFISCKNNSSIGENQSNRIIYPYSNKNFEDIIDETPKMMSYKDYINWVEENKQFLSSEKQIDNLAFACLLKPVDYMVFKDMDTLSYELFETKKKEYSGMQYYVFTIGLRTGEGDLLKSKTTNTKLQYDKLVEYLAFNLQNDITLKDGDNELKCKIFHFEREFGLRPFCNFILGFEKTNQTESSTKTLIYDDQIFDVGIVKLQIPSNHVKAIPKIEIQKFNETINLKTN